MIRAVMADDQPLVRAGLRSMFQYADDIAVVGEAQNGREALDIVRALQPDVVLMDIRMPLMDGIEGTPRSRPQTSTCTTWGWAQIWPDWRV